MADVARDAIVLGGGMVGVATALALQERGFEVTLLDRRAPGQETSYGNAGIIEAEAAEPFAMPRRLTELCAIACGASNEVHYSLGGVLRQAPQLLSYFRYSAPRRHRRIAAIYHRLTARSTTDHAPLVAAAGAEHLIRRSGFYVTYRDPTALDRAARDAARIATTYGVASRIFDEAALQAAEPVSKIAAGAVLWTDSLSCTDPGGLVSSYANLFVLRKGRVVTGDAMTLGRIAGGWSVDTNAGRVTASHAVIALGPWPPPACATFWRPPADVRQARPPSGRRRRTNEWYGRIVLSACADFPHWCGRE